MSKLQFVRLSLSRYSAAYSVAFVFIALFSIESYAQISSTYWDITDRQSILFDATTSQMLPHADNIEMSGTKVSAIIHYELDTNRNLSIKRDIIFPQLRTFNKSNEPDWKKYRAYYRKMVLDERRPSVVSDGQVIIHNAVDSIEIDGMITFYMTPVNGLGLKRVIYPSMKESVLVEEWHLHNYNNETKTLYISNVDASEGELGYKGHYGFSVKSNSKREIEIKSNETIAFPVTYFATLNEEKPNLSLEYNRATREAFLMQMKDNLILESPNEVLNQMFYFSKIRAAESIFESSMGLVHSPGGGNYYVGIWANDQIEYSGPFFPYLNYDRGVEAAYNAYHKFSKHIPDEGHLPYAFEVDGNFAMMHLDRGDAAMVAYGTSKYLLAKSDIQQAQTLWPLIKWSLHYCHNQMNTEGAIQSESDEMEGRIETGTANLSTSTLYYGGLHFAHILAKELGDKEASEKYFQRKMQMLKVIDNYFGAQIEGLDTYRYYDGNTKLRHWICLPLTMGITTRKEATLSALFDKLWTDNGILVEYDPGPSSDEQQMFWDRATLYALRGVLKVGDVEAGYEKLMAYSNKRLLGDHVPYAVEAYPENNMKHLSAESALYARIIIEGLLGIEPAGFNQIKMKPSLPKDWDIYTLKNIKLGNHLFDVKVERNGSSCMPTIYKDNKKVEFLKKGRGYYYDFN